MTLTGMTTVATATIVEAVAGRMATYGWRMARRSQKGRGWSGRVRGRRGGRRGGEVGDDHGAGGVGCGATLRGGGDVGSGDGRELRNFVHRYLHIYRRPERLGPKACKL